MREQWKASCQMLGSGDAATAVRLFREFETWYGNEPEVKESSFLEMRRRLHGLACLQAGLMEDGVTLLEDWLDHTEEAQPNRAYIRFQLASACHSLGQIDKALSHWRAFLENHPELPECVLVRWMWSDLELSKGNHQAALGKLSEILEEADLDRTVEALTKAAMALLQLSHGSTDEAIAILDGGNYADIKIFTLWRSLLAPSIVQSLLQNGKAEMALQTCSWLDQPANLIVGFTHLKINHGQGSNNAGSPGALRQSIWNQHWKHQLDKYGHTLDRLSTDDGESIPYSLKLEALLETMRPRQALVLSRAIMESKCTRDPALIAGSYKSAIRACHQLELWERAVSLADEFLNNFPQDEAIPGILLLNARTAAGQRQYRPALEQVRKLLESYPGHPSANSWKLLEGEWLLSSGQPAPALQLFESLEQEASASWHPFLSFQQGRCLEAQRRLDEAASRYNEILDDKNATATLVEHAHTFLAKIFLRQLNQAGFKQNLLAYRKDFPEGLNHLTMENLAGSFFRGLGEMETAQKLFLEVSREDHPAANFAHEQLSEMYRNSGDIETFREHALAWIQQGIEMGSAIPKSPFLDCLHYQDATGGPALPATLLLSLLEEIDRENTRMPASFILKVMTSRWEDYRVWVPASESSIEKWCSAKSHAHYQESRISAYATYLLFLSDILEEYGRIDSAEARRIQVLQAANPDILDESSLLKVSKTASRYDFPEAKSLLERFLVRHPDSSSRPEALYLLALRLSKNGHALDSRTLLEEVVADWTDSPVFIQAGLELAEQLLDAGLSSAAHDTTSSLLEYPGLPAGSSAMALLLRAKADVARESYEMAATSCIRILNLYPDFQHICNSAQAILLTNEDALSNPGHRKYIENLKERNQIENPAV